jgi:hypothetical protein
MKMTPLPDDGRLRRSKEEPVRRSSDSVGLKGLTGHELTAFYATACLSEPSAMRAVVSWVNSCMALRT